MKHYTLNRSLRYTPKPPLPSSTMRKPCSACRGNGGVTRATFVMEYAPGESLGGGVHRPTPPRTVRRDKFFACPLCGVSLPSPQP